MEPEASLSNPHRALARISILVMALLAPGFAGAETPAEGMRKLHDDLVVAYQKMDAEAIKALYAKRPDNLFFWSRQMTYSWEELEAALDGLLDIASDMRFSTSNVRVGGSGDTGWFAATYRVERDRDDGESWAVDGRWTMVAEKIDGRWLIVHDHESFPVPETRAD